MTTEQGLDGQELDLAAIFGADAATEAADMHRESEAGPKWDELNMEPDPQAGAAAQIYNLRFIKNPLLKVDGKTFPVITKLERYRFKNRDGRTRTFTSPRAVDPGAKCPMLTLYSSTKGHAAARAAAFTNKKAGTTGFFDRVNKTVAIVQVHSAPAHKKHYIGKFLPFYAQDSQFNHIQIAQNPPAELVTAGVWPAGGTAVGALGKGPMYMLSASVNDQGRTYDSSQFVPRQVGILVEHSIASKFFDTLTTDAVGTDGTNDVPYMLITIEPTDAPDLVAKKQGAILEKIQQLTDPYFNFIRPLDEADKIDMEGLIATVEGIKKGEPISRTPAADATANVDPANSDVVPVVPDVSPATVNAIDMTSAADDILGGN